MRKRASGAVAFAVIAVTAVPIWSCLEPTEIEIELTTSAAASVVIANGVVIHVGTPNDVDTNPSTSTEVYTTRAAPSATSLSCRVAR